MNFVNHESIRIQPQALRSFSPCRGNEHWPRDGWKGIVFDECLKHRVKIADLMVGSRVRKVLACRWAIIKRMRATTTFDGKPVSLTTIGDRLGLHHTSVLFALRRMAGQSPDAVKPTSYQYQGGRR